METLLAAVGSSLGGSVIGWFGAFLTRRQEMQKAKIEFEYDLKRLEVTNSHELKMAESAGTQKLAELSAQLESTIAEGEYKGLTTSIEADKASYSVGTDNKWLVAVDVVRGIMRPALTALLLTYLMVAMVYLFVDKGDSITSEQSFELLTQIIVCLTTGANIALTWWFGSRNMLKSGG